MMASANGKFQRDLQHALLVKAVKLNLISGSFNEQLLIVREITRGMAENRKRLLKYH